MNKKYIFIVRHGHADFGAKIDFDRELTTKGVIAVGNTAKFINTKCTELSITPQLCISSAAIRTEQTAAIICKANNINKTKPYKELYTTAASTWLDKIIHEKHQNIIIVGHNPTFSQLVNNLCGYNIQMSPANCAFITLEIKADGIIYPAILNDFYQNE